MADDPDALDSLAVYEIFDQDARPTFIIDLDPDWASLPREALLPKWCNVALRDHERLHDLVTGSNRPADAPEHPDFRGFKAWATSITKHDDSKDIFPLFFEYADLLWTGSTVRKRWRFISGNRLGKESPPTRDLAIKPGAVDKAPETRNNDEPEHIILQDKLSERSPIAIPAVKSSHSPLSALPSPRQANRLKFSSDCKMSLGSSSCHTCDDMHPICFSGSNTMVTDWTVPKPKVELSSHIQFVRSVDWAATPLGHMSTWSREFRQVANLVMANPHPCALFWGSDLTIIYNEAYVVEIAGDKHPAAMGTGLSGTFPELFDGLIPIIAEAARTGSSVRRENDYLPIERYGLLEETYFTWSFIPLCGDTDRIQGFYNAAFETTQGIRHRRQMQTINRLGECVSRAQTKKQFWNAVLEGLEDSIYDVPFAFLYSVREGEDMDLSSHSSESTLGLMSCFFEGALGIPLGHQAVPEQLDLRRSLEGFTPSLREAMRTREPTLLNTRDGSLPESLLNGIEQRGFAEPVKEAVIFPIRPTNGDQVLAFLLLGLNPRRPYDESYKQFVATMNRTLASSLASIILFEDEVRKSRDLAEAATLEQVKLTEELALQTDRFRRMTETSPLGMFLVTPEGVLREANDRFFEMTRLPKNHNEALSWMNFLELSSKPTLEEGWDALIHKQLPWSGEVQLKTSLSRFVHTDDGTPMETWLLFTAQPEFTESGSLRSIMGSITDISPLKWGQGLQNRRLKEAEETRRQQNEFIDMTSHEMRNPLSAILQCADDITTCLEECLTRAEPLSSAAVESCLDASRTINLCIQHQKNIVDDILTISKIDSTLLSITPIATQPMSMLEKAVKMVQPDLEAKQIRVTFEEDPSYKDLDITWTYLDNGRVLQILLNLLTNAIKFTADREERKLNVGVGASVNPPSSEDLAQSGFTFAPISKRRNDRVTHGEEWGSEDEVYIRWKVEDTGVGLTSEEKARLFAKFAQGSHRTHAQYGGTGLGLFICKQLCEMHGGAIGVASEARVGSCFGFYVKAKRCPAPVPESSSISRNSSTGQFKNLKPTSHPISHNNAAQSPNSAYLKVPAAPAQTAFDPSSLHILVVEDNLINQRVLVKQLRKHGCHVSTANDGLEALSHLSKTHFCLPRDGIPLDVVLMDLEMPRMNGMDCVKRIREMQRAGEVVQGKTVPVLAVTANVRDEHVAHAKESGMDGVVAKPFTVSDLFARIAVLLGGGIRGEGACSS